MVWTKRGLLVPGHPPLEWAHSHAALPVADVRGDGVRLYVSTRDEQGRARIALGEVSVDGTSLAVTGYHSTPVLDLGELGAFDDSGVTSSCLVWSEGRAYLYYSGWSLGQTVPFYLYAGCVVSDDGVTFERVKRSPILERDAVDPFLTASPWVLVDEGRWRMWYVSCTGWRMKQGRPQHLYHVKYAESDDGIHWRREGRVCIDFKDESEYAISRPCVVRDETTYRMWFAARGEAYKLGYAESDDGLVWRRLESVAVLPQPSAAWEAEMQAYPVVFDANGGRFMLYNGNDYGATGVGWATLGHD
jgi:hypothetical protein